MGQKERGQGILPSAAGGRSKRVCRPWLDALFHDLYEVPAAPHCGEGAYTRRARAHSALTAGCGRAGAQRRILVCGGLRVMSGAKWTRAADEKPGDKATRADEAAPQPWLSRPAAALAGPGQRL